MSALGTGVSVQETIVAGDSNKRWDHNVGKPALKVEILTNERRPMLNSDWDVDNLPNTLVIFNNTSNPETFIVVVTWEIPSLAQNGKLFEDNFV